MDEERTWISRPAGEPTGDPRVDQAIAGLPDLAGLPLDQRPAVLEAIHDRLREILGELGEAPRPGEPARRGEQGQLGDTARTGPA